MVYLFNLTKIDSNKYEVGGVHFRPFDEKVGLHKTAEQLNVEGVLVTEIPTPEERHLQEPKLFVNLSTRDCWYEYVDRPLTPEEEVRALKEEVAYLWYELMMGGM